ncbi:2-oxoglutarate (2OG) and Fe(II)-dependent oxygenase superfamily protein [Quillaja saponaria]|uniref:2-oxoglutarate (2OG) and Fe(II)-dependent oxygenase superfamily protein n=1 Tax=Quillaja saponaria TaxID=32244 RepID=A0AAD7L041_QUISA|nr:2-oxoglutarate (2OG) and Fe(II)-dependent oxygenase superfamily protein [Quillaja saponaria]
MAKSPESNLEWSLPVPSVRELANQQLEKVPLRYIRDDLDNVTTVPADPSLRVPLIDMTKLFNPNSQKEELQNLYDACKDWGVFQLVNHGISNETLNCMGKQVQGFFDLPLEEKKRWAQKPGSLEGFGQAFVVSEDQKLDWNDMIFLKTLPIHNRKLNLWPENPPEFRKTLERYSEDVRKLAVSIVRFMVMGLQLELEAQQISESFLEGSYDMLKDGEWVFVEPIEGAIVVNIGHIMEVVSNGIYKAPDHRAVVNKWKERLSIVTFCYPDSSIEIGPAKNRSSQSNPTFIQDPYTG